MNEVTLAVSVVLILVALVLFIAAADASLSAIVKNSKEKATQKKLEGLESGVSLSLSFKDKAIEDMYELMIEAEFEQASINATEQSLKDYNSDYPVISNISKKRKPKNAKTNRSRDSKKDTSLVRAKGQKPRRNSNRKQSKKTNKT